MFGTSSDNVHLFRLEAPRFPKASLTPAGEPAREIPTRRPTPTAPTLHCAAKALLPMAAPRGRRAAGGEKR